MVTRTNSANNPAMALARFPGTLVMVFLLMAFSAVAHAEWISLDGKGQNEPQVSVSQVAVDRTLLDITLPGFDTETVAVDGQSYARVRVPGLWFTLDRGQPELPFISSSLIIPDSGTPEVRIVESRWVEVASDPVLPSKGNILRTEDPEQISYAFGDAYTTGGVFPAEAAQLGDPYIMRDYRGVNLRLYPLRWDADRGLLLALESITLEVTTSGSGGVNEKLPRIQTAIDTQFNNIYQRSFDNFDTAAKYNLVPVDGNLLVVCNDAFMGTIQPFVEWKREKGMTVEVISTGSVGGTTTGIKNAIQTRYDSAEGLTYVILVGDLAQVPTYSGTYEGADDDTRYANCEGGDLYPDLFVSRISASNPEDVLVQTNKFIRYERDPDAGGTWYAKAAGLASSEGSPPDHERANWLRDDLLAYGFTHVDQIYQLEGDSTAEIAAAVNEGRSLLNYIGHGSGTSWSNPYFQNNDASNLSNGWMNPWILDVSCSNGDFSMNECFAEAWMRSGTSAAPNGAVAMYSASTSTPWVPPCVMQAEAVDLLVADQANVIGSLCYHGMMQVLDTYPGSEGTQLVEQYNIFGDCTLQVRTATPVEPAVSHSGAVALGSTVFPVETGVAGTRVSIYSNGILHGTGVADETGHCDLQLTEPVVVGGEVLLTLTGYNLLTYREYIPAVVPVVVDIQPSSIPVGQTTLVTVTLTDPPAMSTQDVTVTISGYGTDTLQGVTDAAGVVTFSVSPIYGENLQVRGREAGAGYDMFGVDLPVTGAMDLTSPVITAGVPDIGMVGTLTPHLWGEVIGSAGESDLAMDWQGGGVTASATDPGSTVTMPVMPVATGTGTAAIMKEGYNVFLASIEVVPAFGTVEGIVTDADNSGAPVGGALVSCYLTPFDGSQDAEFQVTTAADGTWSFADELPVADYVLVVSKFGYLQANEPFFLMFGPNSLETSLSLAPAGDLSGTVTSLVDGSPVSGLVKVRRSDTGQQVAQDYTDPATGQFSIAGLTYFDYEVNVTAAQFIPQTVMVTVDSPSVIKNFVLEETVGNILVVDDNLAREELVAHDPKLDKNGLPVADGYQAPGARTALDIMTALTGFGYNVEYTTSSTYDIATWSDYNVVVMASGDNTSSLSTAIKADLMAFVEAGGHLLLEGGEIAYSHRFDAPFAQSVMHITSWGSDSVGNLTVDDPLHNVMSVPNEVTGPINLTYTGYGDSDSVTPAADAQAPGGWTGSSSGASVVCYDPNPAPEGGQIVFFTFNYSSLASGDREDLLHNAAHWLVTEEVGQSSISGSVNVSGAADDSGVTVTLTPGNFTFVTGPDGSFLFDGLFAGNYHLTAVKDGWTSGVADVTVGNSEQLTGVNFGLNAIVTSEFCDSPAVAIPDNDPEGGIVCPLEVNTSGAVSGLSVFLDITHTYIADMVIDLVSPAGTTVRLHNNQGAGNDNIYTWYPDETTPYESLNAFLGEGMSGTWNLHVADVGFMDFGTINSWCLRFTYEAVATPADGSLLPRTLVSEGNFPNPFNPMTTIKFAVPRAGKVDLTVYDVAGRKVATVLSEVLEAGHQSVTWTGRNDRGQAVASGTYFYRVVAGGETVTGKMLLMK
jgi:subtilisin-like proprotein convertase family protein